MLFVALLSLSATYSVAQRYLKIFGGFEKIDAFSTSPSANGIGDALDFQSHYWGIKKPMFARTKYRNEGKRFVELEIGNFSLFKKDEVTIAKNNQIATPINGETIHQIGGAIGYSQNFMFTDDDSKRHTFWLGGGVRLQSNFQQNMPKTSLTFPLKTFKNNVNLSLIPRYTYKFKIKYILDIQLPVQLLQANLDFRSEKNPQATIYQQTQWTPSGSLNVKLDEIRLGFGMLF